MACMHVQLRIHATSRVVHVELACHGGQARCNEKLMMKGKRSKCAQTREECAEHVHACVCGYKDEINMHAQHRQHTFALSLFGGMAIFGSI